MSGYEQHTFWCIKCGNRGLDIQRKVNHKHSKHHRKKLWCPWCKMEINHIECRNDEEVKEFKENWQAGLYQKELKESLEEMTRQNQIWS